MAVLADEVLSPGPGAGGAGPDRAHVCLAHNWYRSAFPSGENLVVQQERALLAEGGHRVTELYEHSDRLAGMPWWSRAAMAARMLGGAREVARWEAILRERACDARVLHCHNLFPLLNYALLAAARRQGMRTVQTLHNYRLLATARHLASRDGLRRPRTAAERELHARIHVRHHAGLEERVYAEAYRRLWRDGFEAIDTFVCLTDFQRRLLIGQGVPADKLAVKPNCIPDALGAGEGPGGFAVFIGRPTPEKGFPFLARAWPAALPLRVIGDFPADARAPGIELLGRLPREQVLRQLREARFLVMNSQCYEAFPLVVLEAFAAGTPCLVPALGPLPELIRDGFTGRSFRSGNAAHLAEVAKELWEAAPAMRAACRREYEERYTPDRNLAALAGIYAGAGRTA